MLLLYRGAANSAARNRQFSTIFGRRSLQCHQAIQHERLNLTSKFAISTTPVTFKRLRPNEIQEKITRLERRKTENQAKAERNKKLVGIIDVYPGMTVGQLTKAVGRTHGILLLPNNNSSGSDLLKIVSCLFRTNCRCTDESSAN